MASWAKGGADSSLTQALPAASSAPAPRPVSSRPGSSQTAVAPTISTRVEARLTARAARATRRRPSRSARGPPASSPGASPRTYTATSPVTVDSVRASPER
ncbi:hypothetical protein LX15_001359 [Streptoalloteichus tenebrarius]|uniref:Uncharacterized protein n=1 Tax=Streptoalloteichus tenebrarius (strain ATCC 17920 / DSM 40477 / JCM 4838 / CBS 697.72 / NBRC 16177 / NCIMB 11028 / NRRL B-12390 / A12253. 1 / ISP 5477) TaxID=1933 RepID=A0ABT1HQ85_STRSD|nr:hypothetical protein [Streptoalloteichus tenebrarius]MCP2257674.1 hypothetical protein [Streptoalloteichus tenebrarius]